MIEASGNTVASCERPFDSVAVLAGLRWPGRYLTGDADAAPYPFEIARGQAWEIVFHPVIERIWRAGIRRR